LHANGIMPNRTEKIEDADRRDRHILVVDDEKAIRGLAERILKAKGYRVTTCNGGTQAVDVYSKLADQIDLVILDMLMPDMTGLETLRQLKETDPSVRAILCSGFVPDLIGKSVANAGFVGFIAKPFEMNELLELAERHVK
jgi:CheY-like chemotaxis protein